MDWFRASLLLLTLVLGVVTGFYLLTAKFWKVTAGRRLAGLLTSFLALCLYVFVARLLPEPPRYALGTILVLILTGTIARMGLTMFSDWRAAGAPYPPADLNTKQKQEDTP
ncbi:membrane protein [Arthrobacter phage Bumble]|uniref:Holin n=1 Tax=Arthrobacter phage Bumble TaxID=2743904 RepID=A0A7G3V9R0_9CAUD|nr:hypothetical protein SEA_BUMBLE_26 [Arthrobacter phage Bumble]